MGDYLLLNKITKQLKSISLILLGNSLYALGLVAFILPHQIMMGGSTGIALTMNYYWDIQISEFVMMFNIVMFIIGALILGKKFALTTIISTFYFPAILDFFQSLPSIGLVTEDPMLATIAGGLLIGYGIGIVIRNGASTGGMDIPPLVLNKKTGIPVSVLLYSFDIIILILQMFYSNVEDAIYGIILILIYSMVLDKILISGTARMQVQIVSEKMEEINNFILHNIDRGSTLLHGETGYFREERNIILTVISNRELVRLKQGVKEIDPKAFLIISHVNEVTGSGFSRRKVYESIKKSRTSTVDNSSK